MTTPKYPGPLGRVDSADWARHLLIGLYVLSILLANLTLNRFIALPLYGQLSVGTIFFAAVFAYSGVISTQL